ncbi:MULTISPECIES: Hsp20/alpha crystallin family protein [unclassified Methanoregula]|uniref:Hsp20/alpha crystallin family protein n=1 Tax=unclassified Methanoregula TaxID=2649730 RepID=UPI0025EE58C3|nr:MULTISPECIES: Hsp20/alpha crystallin family protein [unclassified Methanoregula]
MKSTDFPFVTAWSGMIREMKRLGLDLDPFSCRYPATSRYWSPFEDGSVAKRERGTVFRHEIRDVADEIILVIETHDCMRESIQVYLIGTDAVEIGCIRKRSHGAESGRHRVCVSSSDRFCHVFPLPDEVTLKGVRSEIRNGILEIRLKKKRAGPRMVPIR